jgi:hypothetical protein
MTHKEMEILARQVDVMAEQADAMRVQIKGLLALLAREETAARLGIKDWEFTRLRDPTPSKTTRWRHSSEREKEARAIEREAAIDALIREAKAKRDDFDLDDEPEEAAELPAD